MNRRSMGENSKFEIRNSNVMRVETGLQPVRDGNNSKHQMRKMGSSSGSLNCSILTRVTPQSPISKLTVNFGKKMGGLCRFAPL
jgi:hypothetical protein